MPQMTTLSRRTAMGAALILLAACASVDPRNVTLSPADVQRLVERQFPRQQRLMELLDVSLSNPVVRLLPERNRLTTSMDVLASERLSGRALSGSLSIDHSLRFEPSDATLRLANVKVNELRLNLAGMVLTGQVEWLIALMAEQVLDDFVIYRVSDERRQLMARNGVNNADVAVTSRGIELRFAPSR